MSRWRVGPVLVAGDAEAARVEVTSKDIRQGTAKDMGEALRAGPALRLGAEGDARVLEEERPCGGIVASRELAESLVDMDLIDIDVGRAPEEVAKMATEVQGVSELEDPGRRDPVRPANCSEVDFSSLSNFMSGEGQPTESMRRKFKTMTGR